MHCQDAKLWGWPDCGWSNILVAWGPEVEAVSRAQTIMRTVRMGIVMEELATTD